MRLLSLIASAALVAISLAAHADTFDFNATLQSGSLTGTVDINTATGVMTGEDITFIYPYGNETITASPLQLTYSDYTQVQIYTSTGADGVIYLEFPTTSLVGYTGGDLCTTTSLCGGYYTTEIRPGEGPDAGDLDRATSASLTDISTPPPAVTPEPRSLVLLGTGILGLAGVLKRRLV